MKLKKELNLTSRKRGIPSSQQNPLSWVGRVIFVDFWFQRIASLLAIVFLAGMIMSIVGSIFSLRRRTWGIALTGSISAFICVPILGIAAIILIVLAKNNFLGNKS